MAVASEPYAPSVLVSTEGLPEKKWLEYANCPICGDKRGKMNINFAKNLWRCNYCNEGGGMLALYGKVYGISNSEAYREICDTLQNGLTAPEYTVKELPEKAAVEQSALASPQEIHQTFSMLLDLLTLSPQHRKHLQEVRGLTDEQIERLGYKSTPALLPVPVTDGEAAQPRLQGRRRSGFLCRQG